MYKVQITEEAEKNLKSIPKRDQIKILKRIAKLKNDPRPDGVTKLRGRQSLYRVRQGDWRIIYRIEDLKLYVLIIKIGNRREVYR